MGLGKRRVALEDAAHPLADVQGCGLASTKTELPLHFLQDGLRLPPAHRDGRHRTGRRRERLQSGTEADPARLRAEHDGARDVGGH